jgi:UDP-2-acetamido-3-amino-2,3-dideoxy-glucuronate N-acetyltransferase
VVTRDVPDFALVLGNPARRHGWMCRCGIRLPEPEAGETRCESCASSYRLEGEQLRAG